jgi:hypothetical protein
LYGVAPTQPVLEHKHDGADDPPIVYPRNPMRERKNPFNPTHLDRRQQKQITHSEASRLAYESANPPLRKNFNGS